MNFSIEAPDCKPGQWTPAPLSRLDPMGGWNERLDMKYVDKLKDPRWQRKRLEVLAAADFTCQNCFSEDKTLHVHHKVYFHGREPWEYETEQLAVLCSDCHEAEHSSVSLLKMVCSYAPMYMQLEIAFVIGGFLGLDYEKMLEIKGIQDPLPEDWSKAYFLAGKKIAVSVPSGLCG